MQRSMAEKGQLQRVKIDLEKTFTDGQAYVALSRAVSMESLQVTGFDPEKIRADPKVVVWCAEMDRAT